MKLLTKAIIASIIIIAAGFFIARHFEEIDVDVPYTAAEQPIFQTQLDNGLTVTVRENHANPLATIQFWVKVGSRYEPSGKEGVAHIFEHIWFKGTPLQPTGSFHKTVENLGGELNAMTSHDWTMFYVTVPSYKFNDILPYMADLLKNQQFDQEEITSELQVILEEQRSSFNNPEQHLDDEFAKLIIDEHPYRNPIIGYKDTIANMTREDIIKIYDTYYAPNNINIVVVGDVDTPHVVKAIEEQLRDLEQKVLPKTELKAQTPHAETLYGSLERDLGHNYLTLGYITPEATHEDHYVLDVINALFARMESSRMNEKLKQENLIARGSGISVQLTDFGAYVLVIVTDPETRNAAVTALLKEINSLKQKPVSDEELARAKQYITSQFARKNEEVFEQGMIMGQSWVRGTFDEMPNYLKHINAVTKEDVQRVAKEYFNNYVMYEIKPKL